MAHDVFISFSFKNQKDAEEIVNGLQSRHGISCWICTHDIRAGSSYKGAITEAIKASKVCVLIQSLDAMESEEIPKEITVALNRKKTVIPFVLDDSELNPDLEYDLARVQRIDARKPTIDERIDELAAAIRTFVEISEKGKESSSAEEAKTEYILCSRMPSCSRHFYGRDVLLDRIHETFTKEKNRVIFLHGMGGIGKSEIAKQYAKRYENEYGTIVFARYTDSLEKLFADDEVFLLNGLTRQIKENKETQTDREYADEKVKYLRRYYGEDTLLIIDNFDVETDPYLEELVKAGTFRILITTRFEHRDERCAVIPVGEITDDEALKDLVMGYCNEDYVSIDREDPAFDELFRLTMRHTLALEMVAQYMEETSSELDETVEMLREHGFQPLSEADIVRENQTRNAYEVIRRLFTFSSLTNEEKTFLRCLSMMPEGGISQDHFKKWCTKEVYKCRTKLLKRSLVKFDRMIGTLSLHPLIRDAIRDELKPGYENCREFLECFREDLRGDRLWNAPLSQKQVLFEVSKSVRQSVTEVTEETYSLHYSFVTIDSIMEEKNVIILHLNQLRDACERVFGAESRQVGEVLYRIGWWHKNYDNSTAGLSVWLEKALPVLEKHKVTSAGDYIRCCCDIAYTGYFGVKGETQLAVEEAFAYYEQALSASFDEEAMRAAAVPLPYRRTLIYHGRARLYAELGRYEEAFADLQSVLDFYGEMEGGAKLDGVSILSTRAKLYMKLGDYSAAMEDLIRAIGVIREYASLTNSDNYFAESYLKVYLNLIECCEKIGQTDEIKEYVAQAFETASKIYRPNHPILTSIQAKYEMYA